MAELFAVLSFLMVCSTAVNGGEPNAWEPKKTWVFAVGLVEWENERWSDFPQAARRDNELIEAFKLRGVPESQIIHLKDKQATTKRVVSEFERWVAKPNAGDFLFIYYSGHGFNTRDHTQTYLVTYDADDKNSGVRIGSFLVAAEKLFRGKHIFVAADHCCSGGLAESVKLWKRPRVSYTVFCSAHVNSVSTEAWTFTETIIDALRGEPWIDDDADGLVSVREIASNIVDDMTFAHDQMAQFTATNSDGPDMTFAVAKSKSKDKVGERFEVLDEGTWYRGFIMDADGTRYRVHYYGWPDSEEEWVTEDRLRKVEKETLPVGTRVEGLSAGVWEKGRVIKVKNGLHLVKFDDWGSEWNEWLAIKKLRTSHGSRK